MPVVIDGNNLLYAARAAEDPGRLIGRSILCGMLGAWAVRRGERVHVVFDGPAPPPGRAKQIGHPALHITYSGAGVSADTAVFSFLETDSAARRLLVVSSDRAIVRAAKRRRARTMRSEDFWDAVRRDLARPRRKPTEPEEKQAGLRSEDAERWLSEFGLSE